jgi:hypothetical protein
LILPRRYIPGVFAIQCLLLLAAWIGYGILQWRRSDRIRQRVLEISRTTRVWLAIVALFGSGAAMILGLFIVQESGGSTGDHLRWWAWLTIAVLGLGFVHAQSLAGAMMVSLIQEAVTSPDGGTSTKVEQDLTRE